MDEIIGATAETLIARVLDRAESARFETKRVSGKMVGKALETICVFANTQGGTLVLGVEDAAKASGAQRLVGLAENPEAADELRRKVLTHLLPEVENLRWARVACTLRDGSSGHVLLVVVPQSAKVFDSRRRHVDAAGCEQPGNERGRDYRVGLSARHDQRRIRAGGGTVRAAGNRHLAALCDEPGLFVRRPGG